MGAGGCTHETINCFAGLKTYLEEHWKKTREREQEVVCISFPFARQIITDFERIGKIVEEMETK